MTYYEFNNFIDDNGIDADERTFIINKVKKANRTIFDIKSLDIDKDLNVVINFNPIKNKIEFSLNEAYDS